MGPSLILRPRKFGNPISVTEFANSLLTTWRAAGSHHKHASTIGLAVSGGVDSMALAVLCSRLQQIPYQLLRSLLEADFGRTPSDSPLSRNIRFRAFVVDHGVRKGSNIEAQAVSTVLTKRGIHTQILKIDWGGYKRPGELPNFESLARKYRFQALGKACRNAGINSLLLAHHEDDIVETVMMRLIAGHRAAGLVGMQPSAEIPECYGLHGVHESGGIDIPAWSRGREPSSTSASSSPPLAEQLFSLDPLEIECGGVRIERPLLQFPKKRLIATCKAVRMHWFEDYTNQDPTVTTRNAIRHMYKSHTLPVALSKPALLKLSTKCREKLHAKLDVMDSWLQQCSLNFETRTGTLKVRFANLNELKESSSKTDSKGTAALLLRRIIMLITPEEHVSLPSLGRAVERLFPECLWTHRSPPPKTAFTVAGLYFQPHVPGKVQEDSTRATKCEWLISRQPYMSSKPQPHIRIPPNLSPSKDPSWSSWTLYDGRFWFRVQNLATAPMVIRPFSRPDMADFLYSFPKSSGGEVESLLKRLARYGITWTLPAISIGDLDGKEKVLGLPTLGIGIPNVAQMVKCEVRYKKVDLDNITLLENVDTI